MSLVVAVVEDGAIYAAAETKLTWRDDPNRTAQFWTQPWRKLLILGPELFVGITGSGFNESSEHLVRAAQDGNAEAVEWAAADLSDCDVLIGALNPLRLVRSRFGEREILTETKRAWAGDPAAYADFESRESPAFGSAAELGLQAPMQSMAALHGPLSVGGYVTLVITVDHAFRYRPTPMAIFGGVEACVLAGGSETPGAMAIHLPHLKTGYVYSQNTPWRPTEVPATNCDELVEFAVQALGQTLEINVPCGGVSLRPPRP